MLVAMKPGSVVVDLAAENGGNCVATVPGQLVHSHGVTVIGKYRHQKKIQSQISHLWKLADLY